MKKFLILSIFFLSLTQLASANVNFDSKQTADWNSGYCYSFFITNNDNLSIQNWKVKFEMPNGANLYEKWSGTFQNNGNIYEITPLDWNKQIQQGGKTDLGFCVSNSKVLPKNIEFNYNGSNNYSSPGVNVPTNPSNTTSTDSGNYVTLLYPENKDAIVGIDRNGDTKYEEYMTINPWNISSASGTGSFKYDKVNGSYTYEHNLFNIYQSSPSRWVDGYPEVFVGRKPWGGQEATGKVDLPKKVSDINSLQLSTRFEVYNTSNTPLNFAAEGWLTTDRNRSSGVSGKEIEFMLMFYRHDTGAAGSKVGRFSTTINVDGVNKTENFDLYYTNIGWDFYTFVPERNYSNASIKLDLKEFINELKKYTNYSIENHYLMNFEIGSEYGSPTINYSKVLWKLHDFSFTLNGTNTGSTTNNGGTTTNTGTINNNFNLEDIINTIENQDKERVSFSRFTYNNSSFANLQDNFDNYLANKINNYTTSRYNAVVRARNSIFQAIKDFEDNKIDQASLIVKLRVYINNLKVYL